MKVLLVGVGGVGEAIAVIAKKRAWVEQIVLADYNLERAKEVQKKLGDEERFPVEFIDAGKQENIETLARKYNVDLIMNAVDPVFNKQIFDAAYNVGVTYMDMADNILLVINPNLASLRDARQFLNFARTLSYSEEKINLVLNQSGHKADVKLNDIEKVLHSKILGTIPADEDMMLSCLNDGVPIVLKKSLTFKKY